MVAEGIDTEFGFDTCPLPAKFRIGLNRDFVLRIFRFCLDEVFVGSGLNVKLVIRHRKTDFFIGRLRQHVDQKLVTGIQSLSLFQNGQAVFEHILNIKWPEGIWDEHPVVKLLQLLNIRIC